jgi:hypothetical protein
MLAFLDIMPCGLVALKMEAVCSSELLVPTYKSTRRYKPAQLIYILWTKYKLCAAEITTNQLTN